MDVEMPDDTIIEGVPEGTTKEQLLAKYETYKQKRATRPDRVLRTSAAHQGIKAPDTTLGNMIAQPLALGEAAANMATGVVAKPLADIAGLGAMGVDAAATLLGRKPGDTFDPMAVKAKVEDALTYDPKSRGGMMLAEYNPLTALGRVVDFIGTGVGNKISDKEQGADAPQNMMANAVAEAIRQVPSFVGVKGMPATMKGTGNLLQAGAERVMQGGLKPPIAETRLGMTDRTIKTMLGQDKNVGRGFSIGEGGLAKIEGMIHDTNAQIARTVANSNAVIPQRSPLKYVKDVVDEYVTKNNLGSEKSRNAAIIKDVVDTYFQNPLTQPMFGAQSVPMIPVQRAQALKQNLYQQISDAKGFRTDTPPVAVETMKAIARGLRDDIAQAVPEIKPLNARDHALYTAQEQLERRVASGRNRNIAGPFPFLANSPVSGTAWLGLRSDWLMSNVARAMAKGADSLKGASQSAIPGLAGILMSSEGQDNETIRSLSRF